MGGWDQIRSWRDLLGEGCVVDSAGSGYGTGSCERGYEPSGFGATEIAPTALVRSRYKISISSPAAF
jgi:hypothetical protein